MEKAGKKSGRTKKYDNQNTALQRRGISKKEHFKKKAYQRKIIYEI